MGRKPCVRCDDIGLLCEAHPLEPFQHDDCDEPGQVCPRCVYPFGVIPLDRNEHAREQPHSNVISMRGWQKKKLQTG